MLVAAAVGTGSGGLIDSLQGFPIESRSQSSGFLCLHCAESFSSCHFLLKRAASLGLAACLQPEPISGQTFPYLEDFLWSVQSVNYAR